MEAYTGFAEVYDLFMDDVPYDEWCDYVCTLLGEHQITDGIILDLGCGTGKFTELMSQRGFDMIGVDAAEEMLSVARRRQSESESDILYLLQDMREFELYGTVAAVISICDSMNYITGEEDLLQVFRLVNNYLDPGGFFIFDLNTEYKYREILADHVFAENREEGSFIWENYYDDASKLNEYDLTLYIRQQSEGQEDQFFRYEETHIQKAYSLAEIRTLLELAGLKFVTAYNAFSHDQVNSESERIYIIAKECQKES